MSQARGGPEGMGRVGDLISISGAPAVVSLTEVNAAREKVAAGQGETWLRELVGDYCLEGRETRWAFETMLRSLGRNDGPGDAFAVQGVYGVGKSHLLAALMLLCAHPAEAWPVFLEAHPEYEGELAQYAGGPRLVVGIALDEYSADRHSLEQIVLSQMERELALRHGLRAALTDGAHLLELVNQHFAAQAARELDSRARAEAAPSWADLCEKAPARAARVAVEFLAEEEIPLDWHRSRGEAWGALRRLLEASGMAGPVVLLDELGMFLSGKSRQALNSDASFLQYLAQRTAGEGCWLVCVTQRGLAEVGDVDRRTIRQMKDRFRRGFTLAVPELSSVVERRLVRKRDPRSFEAAAREMWERYAEAGAVGFAIADLIRSYPFNPLCLQVVRGAAEACLSRTRSLVRLLQEAAQERGWMERPADRLITPEVVFDLVREELSYSTAGQRHLHGVDAVLRDAGRVAPGREREVGVVMKTLALLSLGEARWPLEQIRGSLIGSDERRLWREQGALEDVLHALYRWGVYVDRVGEEGGDGYCYFVDVSSDVSERIRRRLNELMREMGAGDSRVERTALAACEDEKFPLAGLAEMTAVPVDWMNGRRHVSAICCDLGEVGSEEVASLAERLGQSESRDDGCLLVALPGRQVSRQEAAWRECCGNAPGRFAAGITAWLPRDLTEREWERLVEHAALSRMLGDDTWAGSGAAELRAKVRARWSESGSSVRQLLQGAYHQGSIVGADGRAVVEPERLASLLGNWEEALAAAFSAPFKTLFPRFASVAPERRLAGRAQTNQIIDQLIRPGRAKLPPASTLEAHARAYAGPLGLLEGAGRELRVGLANRDLVEAVVAAAPRRQADSIEPEETIPYAQLTGQLAKSEWGLLREQSDLVIAALMRTGYLVGLDAFSSPLRLEMVTGALPDSVAYVMRGKSLAGPTAEAARALWGGAVGGATAAWDLPTQERAWGEMVEWAAGLLAQRDEMHGSIRRAAQALEHDQEEWAWAEQALERAEAVAGAVEGGRTSHEGWTRLCAAAARLSGGVSACTELAARWRECQRFAREDLGLLARLRLLLTDKRARCPAGSLLDGSREQLLRELASSERVVLETGPVKSAAEQWLESYRRHYLAWHEQAHAARRFEELSALNRSAALDAGRRLGRAGICPDEMAEISVALERGLRRRCLTGDALPEGFVVCPQCGIQLREELGLPHVEEMMKRAEAALRNQQEALRAQTELLRRRLAGCPDPRLRANVGQLLDEAGASDAESAPPERILPLLGDEEIAWLRKQLGQPRARRRALGELETRLRGKEMAKRDAMGLVSEWLGGEEDDVIEIV